MSRSPHDNTIEHARLSWSTEGLPKSADFEDFYFSTDNACEEKHYVFIEKNDLVKRWQVHKNHTYTICELGFGSGLNFLLTVRDWLKNKKTNQHLHFVSIERFPITLAQLTHIHKNWPELQPLSTTLCAMYPKLLIAGFHHLTFSQWNISLTLVFDDAEPALHALARAPLKSGCLENEYHHTGGNQTLIDSWFFDGFSPAKNPEMWSDTIFSLAANLSHSKTNFSTFTSASIVRKALATAGFIPEKSTGYGKKREMVKGNYLANKRITQVTPIDKPPSEKKSYRKKNSKLHNWHLIKNNNHSIQTAIVIGAGLAGAQTAHALAERGIKVTVIDRHASAAAQASGNAQGVVYTKLSPHDDNLSKFNLCAQLFADRFYHAKNIYQTCGEACGVLHLAVNEIAIKNYRALNELYNTDTHSHSLQYIDKKNTRDVAGIECAYDGLFIPNSGWLNPIKLTQTLLDHKNITIILNTAVSRIEKFHSQDSLPVKWHAISENEEIIAAADALIVCAAHEANIFRQTNFFPTKFIRGQVSNIAQTESSKKLKSVLCGHGYIAPPNKQHNHCVGATFNLTSQSTQLDRFDHDTNLKNLTKMSPSLSSGNSRHPLESGRVAFRTATPDYFPIVGAVPIEDEFNQTYEAYRSRGNAEIRQPGPYQNGLYINIGYGSRGIAYSPIATHMLVNSILGNILPIPRETMLLLHPARFLFRGLCRSKDKLM